MLLQLRGLLSDKYCTIRITKITFLEFKPVLHDCIHYNYFITHEKIDTFSDGFSYPKTLVSQIDDFKGPYRLTLPIIVRVMTLPLILRLTIKPFHPGSHL